MCVLDSPSISVESKKEWERVMNVVEGEKRVQPIILNLKGEISVALLFVFFFVYIFKWEL